MEASSESTVHDEARRQRVRPRVNRRHRRKRRRARQVVTVLLLLLAALVVVGFLSLFPAATAGTHLVQAKEAMSQARQALVQGQPQIAEKALKETHSRLLEARSSIRNPLIQIIGFLPVAGRSADATENLVEAALRVTEAGQVLTAALADIPGGAGALAPADGRIPVEPLKRLAGPLSEAAGLLDQAGRLMEDAPVNLVIPPVRDAIAEFRPLLDEARKGAATAALMTDALPSFLGDEGPRRYFVAAQNPAELRGTGGLIGSYSVLTVRQGTLKFGDFRPVTELDTIPPEQVEPPNPDYAAVWDPFSSRGYWSNINMTPDFPSAATAIVRLYEATEGVRLDGVIATDPYALAGLLKVVGPTEVPGTSIVLTPKNAVRYLTNEAYTSLPQRSRKLILGDAAEEIIGRFIGSPVGVRSEIPDPGADRGDEGTTDGTGGGRPGAPVGTEAGRDAEAEDQGPERGGGEQPPARGTAGVVQFIQVLVDIAGHGHLLLNSSDTDVQGAFEDAGVAGSISGQTGDFLAVVANAGSGTKLDYYLRRRVRYEIDLADDGSGQARTMITLTNTAPDHGQPRYVIGPNAETDLTPGENQLYMSAYCATSCSLNRFSRDGQAAGTAPHEELGHPLFQFVSQIPSGETEELLFDWTIAAAWQQETGGGTYRLVVDSQPGIKPTKLSLSIAVPEGMHVASTSRGMTVTGDRVVWEGDPGDHMVFEVSFERGFLGRVWHGLVDFLTRPVFRLG